MVTARAKQILAGLGSGLAMVSVAASAQTATEHVSSDKAEWVRCDRNFPEAEARLAIPACTRLLATDLPDRGKSTAYVYRGTAYSNVADFDRAFADYERALEAAGSDPEQRALVLLNRGGAYGAQRKEALAMADFEAALALKPDYAAAIAARGITHFDFGRYDQALVDLDRANALNPGFEGARDIACRTRAAILNRELEKARQDCDVAVKLVPGNHRFHVSSGMVALRQQRWEDAWVAFDVAAHLQPRSADALMGRAIAARQLHRADDSKADMDAALALRANARDTYANFGLLP